MTSKRVQAGQTLTDLAVEIYGCEEAVFILMDDNPSVNMDGKLIPGTELKIREASDVNGRNLITLQEINDRGVKIATGTGDTQDNNFVDDDFMDEDYTD